MPDIFLYLSLSQKNTVGYTAGGATAEISQSDVRWRKLLYYTYHTRSDPLMNCSSTSRALSRVKVVLIKTFNLQNWLPSSQKEFVLHVLPLFLVFKWPRVMVRWNFRTYLKSPVVFRCLLQDKRVMTYKPSPVVKTGSGWGICRQGVGKPLKNRPG